MRLSEERCQAILGPVYTPPVVDPPKDVVVLASADVLFGYWLTRDGEDFFVPHRYGGPARIVANGNTAHYEHGVWLWSYRAVPCAWDVQLWRNTMLEYDRLMYVADPTGALTYFVSGRSKGWPVTVPRRQKTPPHPGVLPDDRAFERVPG